jgi:calcineurin-like phosphoesterase
MAWRSTPGAQVSFFFLLDPIYLQSVIIHSENGGKGEGWHVEEYSVTLQNGSEIQFVPHGNHITSPLQNESEIQFVPHRNHIT